MATINPRLMVILRDAAKIPGFSMHDPYIYRPIAHYKGQILKCAGIATNGSRAIIEEKAKARPGESLTDDGYMPGFIVLPQYAGDRITADTHALFEGV